MPTELEDVNLEFHDDIDMQHLNDCIQRHSIALPDLSSDADFFIDNDGKIHLKKNNF